MAKKRQKNGKLANALKFSKKKIAVVAVIVLVIATAAVFLRHDRVWKQGQRVMKIGVLLPLTGSRAVDSDKVLNFAAENINQQGGIRGRKVELVFKDTNLQDSKQLAQEFINDSDIRIVIGPESSAEVYEIAPLFIENKKILISPMATAGDIYRAFGGKKFFWRTCQGDAAQVRTIVNELSERGVKKISLIYDSSPYGKTFVDWLGFFAIEQDIELLNTVSFTGRSNLNLAEAVHYTLAGNPEYVVGVAFPEDAVEIKKELDKQSPRAKLFLTDAAESSYLMNTLDAKSEGIELFSPAADPGGGFEEAYQEKFGYLPWDYAASTYDAFLLSIYTLARQEYLRGHFWQRGEKIEDSLQKIISSQGQKFTWQESDLAVKFILRGELPQISGASGPLRFDKKLGVDPLETFYSLNKIETRAGSRDFWTIKRVSSDKSLGIGVLENGVAAYGTRASVKHQVDLRQTAIKYFPKERKKLKAIIVATSKEWPNYRHQSDALAMYQILKNNGVQDDDIILMLVDDLAYNQDNRLPGEVFNFSGGPNNYADVKIDYQNDQVRLENFENIMLGKKTAATPAVLESDEYTNVFLYIADHGVPGFIPFPEGKPLPAEILANLTDKMYTNKQFRQMLIMVEICHGESMAAKLKTPGVVYLTGAAKNEQSFGTNYDTKLKAWLADDFSFKATQIITANPDINLGDLYTEVYNKVEGSHTQLENFANFGDIANTKISEFIKP